MVKQEPETYSWADFVREKRTSWTGVRNFQARNNLRAMKKGDLVFFYHSVSEKQVVGLARVTREAYPDSAAGEGDWSAVDLKPVQPFKNPVSLDAMKADPILKQLPLIRHTRLSVLPVEEAQARHLAQLGGVRLP